VRAVSHAQVLQPANARGLGRGQAYADDLTPLLAELDKAGTASLLGHAERRCGLGMTIMPTTYSNVSSASDLSADIAAIDLASPASSDNGTNYAITLAAGQMLTEAADIAAVNLKSGDTLTIDGQGAVLNGATAYRGLFVYSGAVTIENLTIENAVAQGGAGASGGSGGAGLGGGLFVADDAADGAAPANVTLSAVVFAPDSAVGGALGGRTTGGGSGAGGGGLGAGGDIFVQAGASLTIASGPLSGGSVTAGPGADGGTNGQAFDAGIFLQGNQNITSAPAASAGSDTQTIYSKVPGPSLDATAAQTRAALNANNLSVTGAGITIGVISDSFNSDNLPTADLGYGTVLPQQSAVKVLNDFTVSDGNSGSHVGDDEGRAMMQIVHDIAPGASLEFCTSFGTQQDFSNGIAGSDTAFADAILALAANGCKVICDDVDVTALGAPWFQSGVITNAIETVEQEGVTFLYAAGNQRDAPSQTATTATATYDPGYQSAWQSTSVPLYFYGAGTVTFSDALQFSNGTGVDAVTLAPGATAQFQMEWSQPWGDATSNIEMILSTDDNGTADVITDDDDHYAIFNRSQNPNVAGESTTLSDDPYVNEAYDTTDSGLFSEIENNTPSTETIFVSIVNLSGPDPSLIKFINDEDNSPGAVTIQGSNSGTSLGQTSPYGMAIGAVDSGDTPAFGNNPPLSEYFSSSGSGDEWLYSSNGTALSSPLQFSPVAVSGVDDINASDVVNGTNYNPNFNDFYGTSAATPSVAAVVALMLQESPNLTSSQIESILEVSATGMANSSVAGAGLVNAAAAVQFATEMLAPDDVVVSTPGQAYSAYEQLYNSGVYTETVYFFTNVSDQPYSSYEYDYSAGNDFIGSRFFYTTVPTGTNYTSYEYDYDGGQHVTRVDYTGVTGTGYSSYEYDFVGGVFAGSKFEVTSVAAGASYSSYELDYNSASAFTGDKFFFTNLPGQSYTGEEEDFDANGALARVVITGVTGQAYSSLEEDFSAGTYEGYKAYYTGITDQTYTGVEVDVSATNQLEKVVYTGMSSTPYSSVEEDFSAGALTGELYDFTNVSGASAYAYQVEDNAGGTAQQEIYDNNDGSHTIIGLGAANQTFTSIADDTFTGGGANETFVFQPIYGADTITDFYQYASGATHDTISLSTSEFANFAAVTAAATNVGSNVVINAADGDMLTLANLNTSTLAGLSADFTFHA
jgi:hypothetical protein